VVSITETDVVAELIYFAIDRELTRIRTSVGSEPKAIDHGVTVGFGITKSPSKKNFSTVMQTPPTTPRPVVA
jgi:hypothetical protein